jgi:hypothetical protein
MSTVDKHETVDKRETVDKQESTLILIAITIYIYICMYIYMYVCITGKFHDFIVMRSGHWKTAVLKQLVKTNTAKGRRCCFPPGKNLNAWLFFAWISSRHEIFNVVRV